MKHIAQLLAPADKFEEQWVSAEWDNRRRDFLRKHGAWCRSCKRSNLVVQVHHINYTRGLPLADYPDEELTVLCKDCHARWSRLMRAFRKLFSTWNVSDLEMLFGALKVAKETNSSRYPALAIIKMMEHDANTPHGAALPPIPRHSLTVPFAKPQVS